MVLVGAILWFIIKLVFTILNVVLINFGIIPFNEITMVVVWLSFFIPICIGNKDGL